MVNGVYPRRERVALRSHRAAGRPGRIVPPGLFSPAEDASRHNVRALALTGLGQRDQADALWRQMLATGKRLDEAELEAVALQNLATSDIIRGEFETAKRNIAESMELMEDLGRLRSIAQLLNSVVLLAIDEGDYVHAASVLDTYEDVARTNRDVSLLTSAHGNRGRLLVQQREFPAAEAEFKKALRLSKQTGDAMRVILSLQNLGAVCADQGRLGDAMRWYRKGVRGAELYELDVHVEVLQRSLAVVLDRAGRHRDALAAFDAARQAARRVGDEDLWAQSTMNIGAVRILAADPESALEPLTEAISAFRKLGEYDWEAHARRNRAAAYVALGRIGEAVSEARRAADLHPASEHEQRAELLTYAAETALSDADMLQTAIELFEESLTEEEAFSQPSDLARHGVLIGASLIEHGAGKSAVAFYDRALNAVENLPEGQEVLPSVLNDRGIAFERLGRHDDARRELRRCIELVDGTDDPNARNALANLVEVERQRGEVSEAVALGRQAVREALAVHDDDALVHAVDNLWLALLDEDEPGSVEDAARELSAVAGEAATETWAARVETLFGLAAYLRADFPTASNRFQHASDVYREAGSEEEVVAVEYGVDVATRAGAFDVIDPVVQRLADLVEPAAAAGSVRGAVVCLGHGARHLLDNRHFEKAIALLTCGALIGVRDAIRRGSGDDDEFTAVFSAVYSVVLAARNGPYPPDEVYAAFNAALDAEQTGLAEVVAPLLEQAKRIEPSGVEAGPSGGTILG